MPLTWWDPSRWLQAARAKAVSALQTPRMLCTLVFDDPRRTAAQIFEAGKVLAEESGRREAQRKARAEAKRKRAEAAERKKYLEELLPKADKTWRKVELLLETTIQRDYDQAVRWLRDLRDLAETSSSGTQTWEERVRALRRRHLRKRSLMKQFDNAGFPP